MLDEFRRILPEDELDQYGPLVEQFPKWSFDRSPISQYGMALVGVAIAVVCVAISFMVQVSDKPEEQLPFQQAMWGFAGVGGVFFLYGLLTGLWRMMFGTAHVGSWWLLFERGLLIVSSGKVIHSLPLTDIRVKTSTDITKGDHLVDSGNRTLPLPLRLEEPFVRAVREQQRKMRPAATGPKRLPYALAWAEAKLFGEDRVFRVYPDGDSVLIVYAGQFLPEQMGAKSSSGTVIMPIAIGLVAGAAKLAAMWTEYLASKNYNERAEYLDAMTIEELREEARNNDASTLLNATNTTELYMGPAVSRFWSNDFLQSQVKARLVFRVDRKKWELAFFTDEDLNFTIQSLNQAFGSAQVVNEVGRR